MFPRCIEAKLIQVLIDRRDKATGKVKKVKVTVGLRLLFGDGVVVKADGKTFVGKGTMCTYTFRYQTYKITAPMRAKYRAGEALIENGKPVWVNAEDGNKHTGGEPKAKFLRERGLFAAHCLTLFDSIGEESEAA